VAETDQEVAPKKDFDPHQVNISLGIVPSRPFLFGFDGKVSDNEGVEGRSFFPQGLHRGKKRALAVRVIPNALVLLTWGGKERM